MMRRALVIGFTVLTLSPSLYAAPGEVPQQVREIQLEDEKRTVHTVEVTGAPNLKTRIQLNDTFSAQNVLCGVSCSVGLAGEGGKPTELVNWMMEVRPEERSLVVWPARLPTSQRTADSFTTNLQIMADGGHLFNITLRLVRLSPNKAAWAPADAVVSLFLPDAATAAQQQVRLDQQVKQALAEALDQQLAQHVGHLLAGPVLCKAHKLARRKDHTLVSVVQLCTSTGEPGLRWALVAIENRGSQPLSLGRIEMHPEGTDHGDDEGDDQAMLPSPIPVDGRAFAVVIRPGLTSGPQHPAWRVVVTPSSEGRRPIELPHLTF